MNPSTDFSDAICSALIQCPGWPKPVMLSGNRPSICLQVGGIAVVLGLYCLYQCQVKTFPGRNPRTCKMPVLFFLKNQSWTMYYPVPEIFPSYELSTLLLLHQQGKPSTTFYYGWKRRLHFNFRWLYLMFYFFS